MKKKVRDTIIILIIVIIFIVINFIWLKDDNKIMSKPEIEFQSGSEFLLTVDCAPLFDFNPLGTKYKISFDLKTKIPGDIVVYQQNGSEFRYTWTPYPCIKAEEKYSHYEVEVEPVLVNKGILNSYLAFYGEYGTGVIPSVKNIIIEPIL